MNRRMLKEAFVTESMKIQSPRLMLGFKNKPLQEAPQKYVQRDSKCHYSLS